MLDARTTAAPVGLWSYEEIARAAGTYQERYAEDPVRFAQEMLGVYLWSKQREVLRSVFENRFTAVKAGHGVGKTFTAAVAVPTFLCTLPWSKIVTTAPVGMQVRLLLWAKVHRLVSQGLPDLLTGESEDVAAAARDLGIEPVKADLLQACLRINPDWFAVGISPNEEVSFQGFHAPHVLIILDEAAGVRPEIWAGARTLMSAGNAHMLVIGNPAESSGPFYEACEGEESAKWNVITISCYDSPNFTGEAVPEEVRRELVTQTWVDECREDWGEDSPLFKAKVLGQFADAGTNNVIPISYHDRAGERWGEAEAEGRLGQAAAIRHLGVDVAWEGDDKTVLALRRDAAVEVIAEIAGNDPVQVANLVGRVILDHGVQVCAIDAIGIGAGTYARLLERQREGEFRSVKFVAAKASEKADRPDNFPNRRSEWWWALREAMHPERGWLMLDPGDRKLKAELTGSLYEIDSGSRIKVEEKAHMKSRLKRSPDRADAVMFALYCAQWADIRPAFADYRRRRDGKGQVPTMAGSLGNLP